MIAVPHYISPQDYLDIERQSQIRHEYRRGLVYAMAGGTDNHDRIAFNFLKLIDDHFGDSQDQFYYYPDAFVTCDSRDRQDRYLKRYPKLIAEVLSPSTAAFDQGEKFKDYQQLETLEEYVLITQEIQRVECRRRNAMGGWETTIYETGDRIILESIGLELALDDLYRGID
jgi:Uma2 family endonuclease